MLIIKEMIQNELLLQQILECPNAQAMLQRMIAESTGIDVASLDGKIDLHRRNTKKAISEYIKQNKESLLADIKAVKQLGFEFNGVETIDRINSLNNNISFITSTVMRPYENLSVNLGMLQEKVDQVKLLNLLQNLSTYYEYGSDFASITDAFILGK